MSMLQTTTAQGPSDNLQCPRCDAMLPPRATFCSSCGERISRGIKTVSPANHDVDNSPRYHMTSLLRRHPYVSLYFATDTRQERTVAIRDIDVSSLDEVARAKAAETVQAEYDLLRQYHIPYVMPVIDLQSNKGHLLTVASQPAFERDWRSQEPSLNLTQAPRVPVSGGDSATRIQSLRGTAPTRPNATAHTVRTLQDLLKQESYLPDQQLALDWITRFCQAVEGLHSHQIVLGDLDPSAIIMGNGTSRAGQDQPMLMVSWLPRQIRALLPRIASEESGRPLRDVGAGDPAWGAGNAPALLSSATATVTAFSAPETLLGKVEAASDVYSLGALLYLLLTGTAPDNATERIQHRLRSPRELNLHISSSIDDVVMRALSFEWSERFQSAKALAEALSQRRILPGKSLNTAGPTDVESGFIQYVDNNDARHIERISSIDTINIVPLSPATWTTTKVPTGIPVPRTGTSPWGGQHHKGPTHHPPDGVPAPPHSRSYMSSKSSTAIPPSTPTTEGAIQLLPATEDPLSISDDAGPLPGHLGQAPGLHPSSTLLPVPTDRRGNDALLLSQRFKERITGILPAIPRLSKQITAILPTIPHTSQSSVRVQEASQQEQVQAEAPLLKQIQRIVLGEQQHTTTSAAIIETPLRIQPDQEYIIRVHIMGRDEVSLPLGAKKDTSAAGLSAHISGDMLYVEVRSALQQSYTYIVQQAAVTMPGQGYVAEVVIPMQPFASPSDGRRERLHIFFLDERRRPLYTKPFTIELFVSHLVQPGREGHHVLPIPL